MKQVYFIPNVITAFGLACGLFVIFKVLMAEQGADPHHLLYTSVLLLLAAGLADVLDGAVARIIKAQTEFGEFFDSLSDAITFGIAPSVLVFRTLEIEPRSGLSFFAISGAMLYAMCGILRLARFNYKKNLIKGNPKLELEDKKSFTGLPIPMGCFGAVSANLFFTSSYGKVWIPMDPHMRAIVTTALFFVLGYFLISRWKFPSVKNLHFRIPSFQLVFLTALLTLFVLYGILYFFSLFLAVVAWGYLLAAWTLSIIRMILGKRSKALADFEPDDDDD